MIPTMRLRFVERDVSGRDEPIKLVRILQQWWRQDRPHGQMLGMEGEWRDVPLEIEE